MAKQTRPLCERCNDKPKNPGERFCTGCRKVVLAEMDEAGYLTKIPINRTWSDERGRNNRVDYKTLGGSAEMQNDGDGW